MSPRDSNDGASGSRRCQTRKHSCSCVAIAIEAIPPYAFYKSHKSAIEFLVGSTRFLGFVSQKYVLSIARRRGRLGDLTANKSQPHDDRLYAPCNCRRRKKTAVFFFSHSLLTKLPAAQLGSEQPHSSLLLATFVDFIVVFGLGEVVSIYNYVYLLDTVNTFMGDC